MNRPAMDVPPYLPSDPNSGGQLMYGYHTRKPTLDDCVFQPHRDHYMDMLADGNRFLMEVSEALSRCSFTRSPFFHAGRTGPMPLRWATQKWICFARRLLGVKPPTRRSKMALRKKPDMILW